ncbi:MAG: extracellular solute-binding protein [Chloroflexi bacterium]|nr:extracellular solute-binding protein [Chloroflexota bacterium]
MFRKFGMKAVVSAITAATVLLAACAGGQGPSGGSAKQGKITVWYFDKVSMETVIPMFEKAYPGVKVNFVQQPFGDMSKKYLAALAAKSGVPDVIGLDTSMVGRFLDAGENLLDSNYNAEQFRKDFIEWKFAATVAPNGEMPVFPWDVATGVMFYKPEIFAKAGLPTDPDEVSKALATWPDFIKAGEKIAKATNGESSIIANPHDVFNAAFWQNGGNIAIGNDIAFVKEGQEPLALAVKANDAAISAKVATWSERWMPALKSGKVATVVMGGWMLGNFQNLIDKDGAGKWRMARAPGGAFDNGGTYLQIPKLAKNKAAAWEFVKFLTTRAETQNAVFQKTGIVPAYTPAWNSPLYNEGVDYLGGQKAWKLLVELAQEVKPLHYSAVDSLGVDLLNAQVDAAIAGKTTPQQALQTAATQLQERAARASNIQLKLPS